MRTHQYIVGSKKDKVEIEKLLNKDCPTFVSYDYTELCERLYQDLLQHKVRNSDDFDYTLCEFLDEMEIDIRQRTDDWFSDFLPYLLNVEQAMHYFKMYMQQLSGMPLWPNLSFEEGTRLSVMMIVENCP